MDYSIRELRQNESKVLNTFYTKQFLFQKGFLYHQKRL